jgi:hypothetical protein
MRINVILFPVFFSFTSVIIGQVEIDHQAEKRVLDSLYILEVQASSGQTKVLHAEPLFIDLARDLGARKGEREWNVGLGLTDRKEFVEYTSFVEYEWAPIDRLGLEIELPFTYSPLDSDGIGDPLGTRLNGIKLMLQYTFLVSEKLKTSLAVGYLHEFELFGFKRYSKGDFFYGNFYNPFFIAAKRWGRNFHTLLYAGPEIRHRFSDGKVDVFSQINSNFHYMIPGTRNFIGIEINMLGSYRMEEAMLRPQMRVSVTDKLMVGIVTGIPLLSRNGSNFSTFTRIIYEF